MRAASRSATEAATSIVNEIAGCGETVTLEISLACSALFLAQRESEGQVFEITWRRHHDGMRPLAIDKGDRDFLGDGGTDRLSIRVGN